MGQLGQREGAQGLLNANTHSSHMMLCHSMLYTLQYTAQKEAEEEAPKPANGTAAAAAADGEAVDEDGKPVSSEMATMLAVDSKRAATAAIRAQVRAVQGFETVLKALQT